MEVAGQAASSKADAAYFLEWIDRLEARFTAGDRVPSPELRASVKGQLDAARAVSHRGALMAILRSRTVIRGTGPSAA